jgi:hypothetical protein
VPLITVTAGTPVLPAATYPATLIGIKPKRLTTKFSKPGTEDDFLEWTWLVEGSDKDVEVTSLTSVATGPKSRIFEYLTALLGAGNVNINDGFDENDLVGKKAQLSIVVTEDGFSKVDQIVAPVVTRASRAAAPAAAPAAPAAPVVAPSAPVDTELDDLPF